MPAILHRKGAIATVTIDRSAKLNALDPDLIADLTQTFVDLAKDDDLRVVVLTGAGKSFVVGADIAHMGGLAPASARAFITSLHYLFAAIRSCPVPVIAAVNGYCLGAGMELAAACDIRIGGEAAIYGMPEVKVGVPSVVEAALLPRLVGSGKAAWLVLTGETIGAEQAHQWGFTEQVVGDADLGAVAMKTAEGIAAAGPHAVRAQKTLVRIWEDTLIDNAVQRSVDIFGEAFETDEPARMMASFAK